MKYHTTISTIIISVAVALLFASVGFFIIMNLNMTSPTLIAANKLLDGIESMDSRFSVSFESMDRNFRDGVFINGFRLEYDHNEILYVNKISLNKGLFSLIHYLISKKDLLYISADYAVLTVPKITETGDAGSFQSINNKQIDLNIPESLAKWGVLLDVFSMDVKYGDKLIENARISLDWSYGLKNSKIAVYVPELDYSFSDACLHFSGLSASLGADDKLSLLVTADSITSKYSVFSCQLSNVSISAENKDIIRIDFDDIDIKAGLGQSHIAFNDASSDISALYLSYIDKEILMKAMDIKAGYLGFGISFGTLSAYSSDLSSFRIAAAEITADDGEETILSVPETSLYFDLKDRKASASIQSLMSGYLNKRSYDIINNIEMNDISANFDFGNEIKADISSHISIDINEPNLDSADMDFSASAAIANNNGHYFINTASVSLSDIKIPIFSNAGSIFLKTEDESVSLSFDFGNTILGNLDYYESLKGIVSISDYKLSSISSLIEAYAPAFSSYIGNDTSLDGSISFDLAFDDSALLGVRGPVSGGVGIRDITFNEYNFNLSSSVSGELVDSIFNIDEGSITTDWVRAGFTGGIDFENMLPYGDFSLAFTNSGKQIINLNLGITGERIYLFRLNSPYLDSVHMSGTLDFSKRNLISSYAELTSGSSLYPFDIDIDFENKNVRLDNPQMHLYSSWMDKLILEADMDDFPILAGIENLTPSLIEGDISFSFDFAEQRFELSSPLFSIKNLRFFTGNPDLAFRVYGDNTRVSINDIKIVSKNSFPELNGDFLFDISNFAFLLNISDKTENGEEFLLSIIRENSVFSGIMKGNNIRLGRFGQGGMIGNLNLTGSGNNYKDFAFTGNFTAKSEDDMNNPKQMSSSVFIDSTTAVLSDIEYTTGALAMGIDDISISSESGRINIDNVSLKASLEHLDRAYTASFRSSLTISIPEGRTFYDTGKELLKNKGNGITFKGSIDSVNYDNALIAPKRDFSGVYSDKLINITGDALSGYVDIDGKIADIDINLMPIAKFRMKADMNGQFGTDYYIDIDSFAVSIANLSINSPILIFYDPAYLYGNLDLIATAEGYRMYGKLDSDYSEFDLFWLPGERVILHNPSFIIWDNVITSNLTDLTCMNMGTNVRVPGKVRLELNFGSSMSFESYAVDVYLDDGNEVNFRLPMFESNIDLVGKVSGHFHIDNITGVVASSGDLKVKDTVLSVGMNELPSWFGPVSVETSTDFNITLASNCKVIFPLSASPILTAFAENDTKLFFHNAKDGIRLNGDFNIRSGEIYYFQKYFYITEGKIHFEENQKTLDPLINLRARLRDFDSDGKQVDIYLNLMDSKLDNLNPTFESSPAKNLNEIMQILGQAILPSSAYGKSSLTSVASLLTTSVDIMSRVGLIKGNGNGLNQSIKDSLGLDIFSMHSNIVSNILTDTIALSGLGSSASNFSPMARYLNGTSIYLGKYLLPEVYMQALFHLTAEENPGEGRHTFISDDLVLDSEFSIEWENPLCTVTFFTKPVNLTFYSILDGFGFTLSKRLIF